MDDFSVCDPMAERILALAPLAAQVDETRDPDARALLLSGMAVLVQSVTPPIRRGKIIPIDGGKNQPEA